MATFILGLALVFAFGALAHYHDKIGDLNHYLRMVKEKLRDEENSKRLQLDQLRRARLLIELLINKGLTDELYTFIYKGVDVAEAERDRLKYKAASLVAGLNAPKKGKT